jgi:HlyD family secretion protein
MSTEHKNEQQSFPELRSEEVQEILGSPPRWIIRWGITIIFLIIIGIFVGSYFIKYPVVVSAPIVVTTENMPAAVIARANGKIDTLFVADNESVEKGMYLGIIENPANYKDVFTVDKLLDSMQPFFEQDDFSQLVLINKEFSMGELQADYFSLCQNISDCQYFVETDYHNKKIASLEEQTALQRNMLQIHLQQIAIQREQTQTIHNIFLRDSLLYKQGAVSLEEYERSRNTYLQSCYAIETAQNSLNSAKISLHQTEQTIFDLQEQYSEKITQLRLSFIGAYNNLKNKITAWKQSYLLQSPIQGIVTFTQIWQRNQYVTSGNVVLTVVPRDSMRITGKITLPVQGAGKVKTGQEVHVKFDNFPHLEYGMARGIVENISLVPVTAQSDRFYIVQIAFPDNLMTNYGKHLVFTQEMSGNAEIITEDIRLLDRLTYPLKSVLKR